MQDQPKRSITVEFLNFYEIGINIKLLPSLSLIIDQQYKQTNIISFYPPELSA